MPTHRFFGEDVTAPQAPVSAATAMPSPGSFLVCPFFAGTPRGALTEGLLVGIYQLAYQQAKVALSPPRHERYFMASAN